MAYDWKSKFKHGCTPTEQDYQCLIEAIENSSGGYAIQASDEPVNGLLAHLNKAELMAELGLPPVYSVPPIPQSKVLRSTSPIAVLGNDTIFNTTFEIHPGFTNAKVDVEFTLAVAGDTTPTCRLLINNGVIDTQTVYLISQTYQLHRIHLHAILSAPVVTHTILVQASCRGNATVNPSQTIGILHIQEY